MILGVESGSSYRSIEYSTIRGHPSLYRKSFPQWQHIFGWNFFHIFGRWMAFLQCELSCGLQRVVFQLNSFHTEGNYRVLDHCYSPSRDAYKSLPHPPFGKSDHSLCLLIGRNWNEKHPPSGQFNAGRTNRTLYYSTVLTEIVLIDDQNVLVTKDFETVGFVEHLHAYHIRVLLVCQE